MLPLDPSLLEEVAATIDEHAVQFRETGKRLYDSFEDEERSQVSTQLRNLQQAAVAAQALYEVEYFVKNQMGRDRGESQKWLAVGDKVLEDLEVLRRLAKSLAERASGAAGNRQRLEHELRLRLVRGWIKVVVAEYMYKRARRSLAQRAEKTR